MEKYRIENIQKAKLNGVNVKLFNAYEYDEESNAYIHIGQFSAPAKTANKDLENFIDD
jgi:hypothetical protein